MSSIEHIETLSHIVRLANDMATLRQAAIQKDASGQQNDELWGIFYRLDRIVLPIMHQALSELEKSPEVQAIRRQELREWEEYMVEQFGDSDSGHFD